MNNPDTPEPFDDIEQLLEELEQFMTVLDEELEELEEPLAPAGLEDRQSEELEAP